MLKHSKNTKYFVQIAYHSKKLYSHGFVAIKSYKDMHYILDKFIILCVVHAIFCITSTSTSVGVKTQH